MTNKELQDYLKTFPDDAEIECIEVNVAMYYTSYSFESLTKCGIEFLDFKNDNYLPGKSFIRIGVNEN